MPEDEDVLKLETAKTLLAECPSGRELLDIADKQELKYELYWDPFSGSRGFYYEEGPNRVVALNAALDPSTFLCALAHEVEHAKQSHDGFLKFGEQQAELDPASERNLTLLAEAGAMAKTAVVLCQLYQLGWEQPERQEELQKPFREAVTDHTFADLYAKCHREHREHLQSLYNGEAFEKTAAIYCQDADRVTHYLEQVEEGAGERYLQDREFRGEVIGVFHAGLPAVTRNTRWELLHGVAHPRPLEMEAPEHEPASRATTPLPTWEDPPQLKQERRRVPGAGYGY